MTNMEGGEGGESPALSSAPQQDQPTDLRVVSRAPDRAPQEQAGGGGKSAARLKQQQEQQPSPPPLVPSLTALPLGLQQLHTRAPSSFMIGDILRQKAQAAAAAVGGIGQGHHDHHHLARLHNHHPRLNDDEGNDDEDDDDEDGSQHALSGHGELIIRYLAACSVSVWW